MDDEDLPQSDDVSEGNEENYRKHKKYKLKKDIHHQTESIGQNPLEHETFSMGQQATFQVDPNTRKKPPAYRPQTSQSGIGGRMKYHANGSVGIDHSVI